jgi:hypothetical protein
MSNNISRRAFIGKVATLAGTLALHNLRAESADASPQPEPSLNANNDDILDVAIVGGGISGIYGGWLLLLTHPIRPKILGRPTGNGRKLSVKLFEGSRRIGGRLLSARPPAMSAICKLGGMRIASSQTRVVSLVKELGLLHHRLYTFDSNNQSLTDLPMRQCWYWTESQHANCGSGESDALIMAYNDALNVDFWRGLRPSDAANLKLADDSKPQSRGESSEARLRDNWNDHSAPAELWRKCIVNS